MQVHVIRAPCAGSHNAFMEENYRLRHAVFVDLEGWNVLRRPDLRDVDRSDTGDMLHLLVTDGDELVGGARLSPLSQRNLLQTEHNGLVHGAFPADYSLGADWTRFDVCPDRREYRRCTPESAALLCAATEYPLVQGLCSPPLSHPFLISRKPQALAGGSRLSTRRQCFLVAPSWLALWIFSKAALADMRRLTRTGPVLAWLDREWSGLARHRLA
jgi:acyl-homoserine lactone synthase